MMAFLYQRSSIMARSRPVVLHGLSELYAVRPMHPAAPEAAYLHRQYPTVVSAGRDRVCAEQRTTAAVACGPGGHACPSCPRSARLAPAGGISHTSADRLVAWRSAWSR